MIIFYTVKALTSSVISVAMDLPISWYWGPFPRGPKSRKRNLGTRKILMKYKMNNTNLNVYCIHCRVLEYTVSHYNALCVSLRSNKQV